MSDPLASSRPSLRARLLAFSLALVAGIATSGAQAQAWPAKPIKLIVPAAPGGSSDPIARLAAEELTRALGQAVIVENRPGANGNIGAAAAARAAPDGYTLVLGWPGTFVSAVTLYDSKPFHPQRDFEPICSSAPCPTSSWSNRRCR